MPELERSYLGLGTVHWPRDVLDRSRVSGHPLAGCAQGVVPAPSGWRVAIKRHPLGRLFYSSDQPGAGSFTIDGLPDSHKGRCFFVFWRRDGDCLLSLIELVRFIDPDGREIAASSPFRLPPADEVASLDIVGNDGAHLTPPRRLQRIWR